MTLPPLPKDLTVLGHVRGALYQNVVPPGHKGLWRRLILNRL